MTFRRAWPAALLLLIYVQTTGFAGAAARDLSQGQMPWHAAILWQGLNYGTWLPFVGLVLWLARRLGLTPKLFVGSYPLIVLYTLLHALISVWLAHVFAGSAPSFKSWLYRLPIDVLIATAIATSVVALRGYRLFQDEAARAGRLQATLDAARTRPISGERMLVSVGRSRASVSLEEVEWFAAAGNYVVVNWASREGLVRETLASLGDRLDPAVFIRAHRSTIVNLTRVRSANTSKDGGWVLTLTSGTELAVSRSCRDAVLARLGRS